MRRLIDMTFCRTTRQDRPSRSRMRPHGRLGRVPVLLATLGCFAIAGPGAFAQELSDQGISDKVSDEMVADPGVISHKVDVSTSNGIVTLDGTVNNLLAKERAVRVAEIVKGVRAVVNRVEVRPSVTRKDADIESDVEVALLNDPATESYELTVNVDDGQVRLSGSVDSYQEKDLAHRVAKGVRGVVGVEDDVTVDYETKRPDYEIADEIRDAIHWDRYLDDHLIDVAVDNGQVELSGIVGSAAEKRMARTKGYVAGVESVDSSDLEVESWARSERLRGDKFAIKPEDEIEQAVNDALLWDPRTNTFDITVSATGSEVTLRGVVDNLKAKRMAEQDARNTVGVLSVENRIKVRPDEDIADLQIERDIQDRLGDDALVDRFDISLSVSDGVAHLYGEVDTTFEKSHAEEIASRVWGVVDVQNHLDVDRDTSYLYDPYVDEYLIEENEIYDYALRNPLLSDSELKEEIESELWWSPFVNSDDVKVKVDNGVATLTGKVESWSERQRAKDNAYQGGATLVENEIEVTSGSS